MIIDFRTRLPHGHLTNKAHDMRYHATQLANCAAELRVMQERLTELMHSIRAVSDSETFGVAVGADS